MIPHKKERYRIGQKAFTRKEFEKLMSAVGSLEDKMLLLIAVNTGLRRRDMTGLEIQNINLNENSVTYYENKKRRTRTIFISNPLSQEIGMYLKTLPKSQRMLFKFGDRTAYNRLNALCRIAGIPQRPFHALRATCIKFCQQAGWTPEEVAELTGDSIRVIQEHYSTPSMTEMRETAERKQIW